MNKLFFFALCLLLSIDLSAKESQRVAAGKRQFDQSVAKEGEVARVRYVTQLAAMFEESLNEYHKTGKRGDSSELDSVIAELRLHPMPKECDGKALSKVLPGEWDSPRHSYKFTGDGKWFMLPIEANSPRGAWRIEGNQFRQGWSVGKMADSNTLILLSNRYFIYTSKGDVFFHSRTGR